MSNKEELLILADKLGRLSGDEFLSIVSTCLVGGRNNMEGFIISSELLALVISVASLDTGNTKKPFEEIAHILIDSTCKDLKEKMLDPMVMIHAEKIIEVRERNKHV